LVGRELDVVAGGTEETATSAGTSPVEDGFAGEIFVAAGTGGGRGGVEIDGVFGEVVLAVVGGGVEDLRVEIVVEAVVAVGPGHLAEAATGRAAHGVGRGGRGEGAEVDGGEGAVDGGGGVDIHEGFEAVEEAGKGEGGDLVGGGVAEDGGSGAGLQDGEGTIGDERGGGGDGHGVSLRGMGDG
jgi:hypothetical protein